MKESPLREALQLLCTELVYRREFYKSQTRQYLSFSILYLLTKHVILRSPVLKCLKMQSPSTEESSATGLRGDEACQPRSKRPEAANVRPTAASSARLSLEDSRGKSSFRSCPMRTVTSRDLRGPGGALCHHKQADDTLKLVLKLDSFPWS